MEPVCQGQVLNIEDVVDVRVSVEFHPFSKTERFVNAEVESEETIASFASSTIRIDNKTAAHTIDLRLSASARIQGSDCRGISSRGEDSVKTHTFTQPIVGSEPVSVNVQARGWRERSRTGQLHDGSQLESPGNV